MVRDGHETKQNLLNRNHLNTIYQVDIQSPATTGKRPLHNFTVAFMN